MSTEFETEPGHEVGPQPLAMLGQHGRTRGFGREIGPLVRIVLDIVELFRAIGVADVAPALAPHAMIPLVMRSDRRTVDSLDAPQRLAGG